MVAGVNTYANQINDASVVIDAASEALNYPSTWAGRILPLRQAMPKGTQVVEVRKNGRLVRKIVAENAQYVFDSTSELVQTRTLLSPIKSVIGYKETVEVQKFSTALSETQIGAAMGDALRIGFEEDVATTVTTATSSVSVAGALTPLEIAAAIFDIRASTRNKGAKAVVVISNKQAFEAGLVNPYSAGATVTAYGDQANRNLSISQDFATTQAAGFVGTQFGADIFATDIIDDTGTQFIGAAFYPELAIAGVWDDQMALMRESEMAYLRDGRVGYVFSDFAIHWDEAICKILSNL